MANKGVLDNYRQWAVFNLAVVDAGGAQFTAIAQLVTGLSNLQKVAWAVSRIEYYIPMGMYAAAIQLGDNFYVAITANGSASQTWGPTSPPVYDYIEYGVAVAAAAGNPISGANMNPIVRDFGLEPMLMLPQNLYIHARRFDATAANTTVAARIHYKEVELGPENWYDLLQLRLPLGATA